MEKQVRILVSGRVQGVSFRYYTQRTAAALGLRGYVHNLDNGDVEIVAEGEADRLERLAAWARVGPPLAHIETADVTYSEPSGAFHGFFVRLA
jgi:acylphosphatase